MATAQQKLEQAKQARHDLITGKLARVFMDQNGERVEFNKTSISDLDSYIAQLELELNPSLAPRLARKPLRFVF